ncbi:DMT family transporter [Xenorhabdus doucetiae]|uniref:Threonine/homoserine exporter RhtA n=1 Tax=Xenorhabdus doucetiae TaxID=351671 RepID=A0A068QSI0_9GAMM|nr:DMT family transporter [Xenorhabdus doucetiae]TYP04912.1 EamA-like transporter family protein [Xenorhabdus doucetiae]CDG16760.1 Transporter, EamA family [Xenorhabdus doucetiae]
MKNSYSTGVICCLIATLSWGATFPIMTSALTRIDPYTFTLLRYGFAGIALLIALFLREGKQGLSLKGERIGLVWLLGSVGFVGFGFFVFLGQQMAGKSGALTASIMMATMPMLSILVNWVLRKVAPPAISIGLILMSFFGVMTVITKGHYSNLFDFPSSYSANGLIILGALCWVIYTVGASFFPTWSPLKYTALTTYLGVISIVVLNGILYACGIVPVPAISEFEFVIPHVFYTAFIAGFIGILCWNIGNKILTPLNGVLFMDIVPITAFSISAMTGIKPSAPEIAGACITGSALILNNLYLRYRSTPKKVAIPIRDN